jgi:TolB-like protein
MLRVRRRAGVPRERVPACGSLIAALVAVVAIASTALASGEPGGQGLATTPRTAGVTIAVLPLENRAGTAAPLEEIRASLRRALEARSISLLNDVAVDGFMRRVRMRYVGGLSRKMGQALADGTWANAVLVTSLDLYGEVFPPRFALSARLVSAGDETRILWIDSASGTGEDAPGFLGLGRIDDIVELEGIVIGRLADSLAQSLTAAAGQDRSVAAGGKSGRKFRPATFYRSPATSASGNRPRTVAVLPFANESTTKRAGEIVTHHLIRHLANAGGVEVVEPGVVRQALLQSRLIQQEGLSLPQVDLVRVLLNVDVALFGEVSTYREAGGGTREPEVDFSVRAIDTGSRQVIWASNSNSRGEDGVFFFDIGRVTTAHDLASAMAGALVETILPTLEVEEST